MKECTVVINGISGKMGIEIVSAAQRLGIEVLPFGLTSGAKRVHKVPAEREMQVELYPYTSSSSCEDEEIVEEKLLQLSQQAAMKGKQLIIIDFTLPNAALTNWELYCKLNISFVMGTTGFDHGKMIKDTLQKNVYAVIAPNMCKQIVALQAMISSASENFPGCFHGYGLDITESHQKTKVDTSGTAKAMLNYFNKLTNENMPLEDVKKIRTESEQLSFGVPESALAGHAFHTYTLTSEDNTVQFQFKHNVCGRRTYAEGVMDAVLFLNKQIAENSQKKVFDMIDVLKAGSMR